MAVTIEKGNMTDAEYIAALISENKRLSAANTKLETANEKLSVEVECLKKDCHIYLEALILSKNKKFGRSSERTTDNGQQSFFMKLKLSISRDLRNLFQRQSKAIQEKI